MMEPQHGHVRVERPYASYDSGASGDGGDDDDDDDVVWMTDKVRFYTFLITLYLSSSFEKEAGDGLFSSFGLFTALKCTGFFLFFFTIARFRLRPQQRAQHAAQNNSSIIRAPARTQPGRTKTRSPR